MVTTRQKLAGIWTCSLESEDVVGEVIPSVATAAWSLGSNGDCLGSWLGLGTVGRVHSNTVNGRANDLSYIEI